MNILSKLIKLVKGNKLTLIEIIDEKENIKSYQFKFESDLHWKAGQHGIFKMIHKKIDKSIRPFSISSTPEEGFVQITTRIDPKKPSEFKKALSEMIVGNQMKMYGPVGNMVINKKNKVVLIAGGIGITPFRSIIEHIKRNHASPKMEVTLIYIDSSGNFLFHPSIEGDYLSTFQIRTMTDRAQFKKTLETTAGKYGDQADYLISGSAPMVKEIINELKNFGVPLKNIKNDSFYGLK